MKTILVPVEQHSTLPSVLETALLVGRSVVGYIEGFAVGPDLRNIIALGVVFAPPMLDDAQREMVETPVSGSKPLCTRMQSQKLARSRTGSRSAGWGTPSKMIRSLAIMVGRSTSSSSAAPDRAAMVHAPPAWKRLCSRVAGRFWSPLPGPPSRSADRS